MNRAKGIQGRGGYPHGKEYEGRRHGGGGAARRYGAARVEKTHETKERQNAKREIKKALEVHDGD